MMIWWDNHDNYNHFLTTPSGVEKCSFVLLARLSLPQTFLLIETVPLVELLPGPGLDPAGEVHIAVISLYHHQGGALAGGGGGG